MTTHQLLLNQPKQAQSASGVDVLFFLLGMRNASDEPQQQSLFFNLAVRSPVWGLGLGIIGFTLAGTWTCLHAMA